MKFIKLFYLLLLFPVFLFAQDDFATVIFEKNGTEGNDDLLYFVYNELGKVQTGRVRDTPLKLVARKDTLDYCYISNTTDLTSFFYFKAGDTIRVIQNPNWDLQYAGSHEKEFKLIAELYKNKIISFDSTFERPRELGLEKAVPYAENLVSKGYQIVDTFKMANPDLDMTIIERIRMELKYRALNSILNFYLSLDYLESNFNLIQPLFENELKTLESLSKIYNYGGHFATFKSNMGSVMYLNTTKEKVLLPYEKEYPNQIREMMSFFLSLPDFLKEDVMYYTLADLFNFRSFGGIDVKEFTSPFFQIATSPKRIQKVKEWDNFYGYLQDSKNQADYIIRAPELREFPLEQLDGTMTTLGELFDSLNGSPIYLDFWATWCAPCRVEMNKLSSDFFNDKNTKMVYLSIDEDKEKWKSVAEQNYRFDGQVKHVNLKLKNIIIQRLFDGGISIPRYIYINGSQTELHKNTIKPSQFDWE